MTPLVEEGEQLYRSAVDLIRQADSGRIGTAMIQRRLRVGYNRAYRLMEMMERRGVVTGPDDQGIRTVKGSDSGHVSLIWIERPGHAGRFHGPRSHHQCQERRLDLQQEPN